MALRMWKIWRETSFARELLTRRNLSIVRLLSKMPSESDCTHNGSEPPVKRPHTASAGGILEFSKLTENAFTPTRGSKQAAGYDLYSAYDYLVPARGKQVVLTDLQIGLPEDCYGRVAPRSGLAAKHFIDVGAGVIDRDYRGNVGVVMFNFSEKEFEVKKGDRIAQLICEKICMPELVELETLEKTERGDGGFGSTGKN